MTLDTKRCPSCERDLERTEEFFYRNNKKGRKTQGWQSYCRDCWPTVNKANKTRRKQIVSG